MPDQLLRRVQRTCAQKLIERIGTMIWDLILVTVCCIYAFRTRKLPNNYKESRFITFCVFSSLLVLLAFSPTIFTTREPFYRSVYSALGLIVIGTVANLCLFVIKFYALYFVSEKDLVVTTGTEHRRTSERNGSVAHVPSSDDNSAIARHKDSLTLSINPRKKGIYGLQGRNKMEKANPVTLQRMVVVPKPVSFTSLNPHMPALPTRTERNDKELEDKERQVSEGDVNLAFKPDEDDEGVYNLDDRGGVYCGPTETVT